MLLRPVCRENPFAHAQLPRPIPLAAVTLAQIRQRRFHRFAHLRMLRDEKCMRAVFCHLQDYLKRSEVRRIERQLRAVLMGVRKKHHLSD